MLFRSVFILSVILLILTVSVVGSYSEKLIESCDIVGSRQEIGLFDELCVSFIVDENRCLTTDFFLVPTRTSLTVSYIECNANILEVFLYDADYPEHVQSGFIESTGDSLTFTNLFGGKDYYISAVMSDGETDKIILRFSK